MLVAPLEIEGQGDGEAQERMDRLSHHALRNVSPADLRAALGVNKAGGEAHYANFGVREGRAPTSTRSNTSRPTPT